MPREIVSIAVLRKTNVADGAGGYTQTESAIGGSPFVARVYRRQAETTINFATPVLGQTDADRSVIISFQDPAVPVQLNDIAVLIDGTRARILRIRRYDRDTQCDIVVGVD